MRVVARTGPLGEQLVGTVSEITKERLHQLGPPYEVGDLVGLGGLQSVFETRLAGSPAAAIVIQSGTGTSTAKVVRTVKQFPGRTPQPVDVTIDPGIQQAADTALAGGDPARRARRDRRADRSDPGDRVEARQSVRPRDRRAVPTRLDLQSHHVDRAAGRRPHRLDARAVPADHQHGRRREVPQLRGRGAGCDRPRGGVQDLLQQRVHRPRRSTPHRRARQSGRVVRVQRALVTSGCLVRRLVSDAADRAELAASAIGQGRVLASPLQMASVAAAVASGQWRAPVLIDQARRAAGHRGSARSRSRGNAARLHGERRANGRHRRGRGPSAGSVRQDGHRRVRRRRLRPRRTRGSSGTAATSRSR